MLSLTKYHLPSNSKSGLSLCTTLVKIHFSGARNFSFKRKNLKNNRLNIYFGGQVINS
jgi:hypothetical protein